MPAILVNALLSLPFIGAYAMFALGIAVIYRASRVLNLAHGAMAMVPAYVAYSLSKAGAPVGICLLAAVLFGAGLGIAVEWAFVRRLRPQGSTAQTVGTVAVTGLLIALTAKIWGTTPRLAPGVFPDGVIHIGASGLRFGDIGLFLTGVVAAAGLFTFFNTTEVGLAMRGAAQNRRAAALMGIDPDLAASAAWALGGGLAALAGVMLAAVTNLDPYSLSLQVLPAFVAALIGGLESLPGAIWGAGIAGLAFGIVPYFAGTPGIGRIAQQTGSPQLALTLLALVVMMIRGRRIAGAEESHGGLLSAGRPLQSGKARSPGTSIVIGILVLVWPFIVPFTVLQDSLLAIQLAVVAMSIVVLTGWVGQISLAQASFVGIAALTMGLVVRGLDIGFPVSMFIAAGAAAAAAVLLGTVALRVRGLYLAVATLVFAWMGDTFLFRSSWFGASSGSSTMPGQHFGTKGGWPFIDLTSEKTLYYVFAGIAALALFSLANLRDTKTGRAFFAVRGSEMAAASVGIDVVRYKLIAFALAGVLAGVSGSMIMLNQRAVVPDQFLFTISLQYLAIAVVGGLGSLGGAIAAGAVFAALNELFLRVSVLSGWLEVVSAGLLAIVLVAYPGGLIAAIERTTGWWTATSALLRRSARRVVTFWSKPMSRRAADDQAVEERSAVGTRRLPRRALRRFTSVGKVVMRRFGRSAARRTAGATNGAGREDWFAHAFPVAREESPAAGNGNGRRPRELRAPTLADFIPNAPPLPPERADRTPILEAANITVRFGGLLAVDDASIEVRAGEIVGLIGPNGAGKTTLFNAILGLNDPESGRVGLYGSDATRLQPHERARLGVARSFQVIQLFSDLTVFDNLLVATHMHNEAGLIGNLAASPRTITEEQTARTRVRHVLALLGLQDVAHLGVRGLPFGTLRMVELGRALVTGARFVMLDEPASGLNNAETDRLIEVVRGIRALGVAVLLIEHDVRMVTGVSDYVYVLDQGRLIAQGPPATVQRDARVVQAYLGVDASAVEVSV